MTLQEFRTQMCSGGVFALAEPSEPTRLYIAFVKAPELIEGVLMYSTIQKYIETEKHIVIVSLDTEALGRLEGCGVEMYRKEDVRFEEAVGEILVTRKPPFRIEVCSNDYLVKDGTETVTTARGETIRIEKETLTGAFWDALFKTGFISPEEYAAMNCLEVASGFPRVVETFIGEEQLAAANQKVLMPASKTY